MKEISSLQNYKVKKKTMSGANSSVWKAVDKRDKSVVSLKKFNDPFKTHANAQRTIREIMMMYEFSSHVGVLKPICVLFDQSVDSVVLTTEFLESDLHKVIRGGILEVVHKKYVTTQIIEAVRFLHSFDVIHRDLKPANILINEECVIKIAEFGLARSLDSLTGQDEENPVLTDVVATRWYRAPEILLGSQKYTKGLDMWSIGCILGELISSKPLFPGDSTLNQLDRIFELTGKPTQEDIEAINSPWATQMLESIPKEKIGSLDNWVAAHEDREVLGLLKQLLMFNPDKRISAADALKHTYIKEFGSKSRDRSKKTSPIRLKSDDPVLVKKMVAFKSEDPRAIEIWRGVLKEFIEEQEKKKVEVDKAKAEDASSREGGEKKERKKKKSRDKKK
eukprot:TRINITY_DN2318_c0_g1_i1.p1 TRINITY_DN2318_c0_g1~~TRINITY_DN2318_c0_g1_i1.p1  ORF type:complete len:393 (+),score=86.85 TRINITY_DN2318_c0_g1_i1:138-1316(+)